MTGHAINNVVPNSVSKQEQERPLDLRYHALARPTLTVDSRPRHVHCAVERAQSIGGPRNGLRLGGVMAEVTIDIGAGKSVVSVITRASAEALALKDGDDVVAVIKSTEILVGKP